MVHNFIFALLCCAIFTLCNTTLSLSQSNSWEKMSGPTGGWIRSPATHPSREISTVMSDHGIYHSDNDGEKIS